MIRRLIGGERRHADDTAEAALPRVLLVGNPNVGKSALFNRLTGRYVTVSNYPGTTVEVARGRFAIDEERFEVIDTPGMYSMAPICDEERVACRMLLSGPAHAVLHVVDAKNVQRMLGLTLQLIEAGLPVILVLNMADEARRLGVRIDTAALSAALGVPVVETVATRGKGIAELAAAIEQARPAPAAIAVDYDHELEQAIATLAGQLENADTISPRTRAILLLQEVGEPVLHLAQRLGGPRAEELLARAAEARRALPHSVHYHVTLAARSAAQRVLERTAVFPDRRGVGLREKLSRLCMNPVTGIPLLAAVLYFGLFKFVGGFGAGTLVDWLEVHLFDEILNPAFTRAARAVIPWPLLQDLFVGEFGILTLGLRYAVAIVLPIVGTFFLAFSILEDSGYLPRLAMLLDRLFKKIGLNGRAVIPIVLGFGCDSMATLVTRTLETRREKVIASFLLALAIPCSAQLGVIMGLLVDQGHTAGVLVWAGTLAGVFLLAGFLAARLLPGEGPSFYMELPPLRLPRPGNMAIKTYSRMVWYFREVLPLFLLASVLIWLGQVTGMFDLLVKGIEPAVRAIGLPDKAAVAMLFGFFRRDYGAAGLYDLKDVMTGNQLTVASIVLTLFLPCVAQFLILKKERGWRMAGLTSAIVLATAFVVGYAANAILALLKVQL